MGSSFDLASVEPQLAGTLFAGQLHHVAITDSTNTLALTAAQAGAAVGVWIADEQTAGRGRGGHAWHSAPGDGLYLSALVRPQLFGVDTLKLSLAAGLAASQAVQEAGFSPNLRWPNDLMIQDQDGIEKKFGGILTESAMQPDGALAYAVIGIGMNLNHTALPPDLSRIATSLRIVSGEVVSREQIVIRLLKELSAEIALLDGHQKDTLATRFELASTWVRGLPVHVAEDAGYTGVTDGLDPHGLLRVRLDDGTIRTVRHGGVRRRE